LTQAVNTVTVSSNGTTKSSGSTTTLPIYVVGCDIYTPQEVKTQDCVKPAHWWPHCDADKDSKCSTGWKLLPGGKGKGTLFFPKPNERTTRSYGSTLLLPVPSELTEARSAYINAAQQFVAAQLNFLSGARLPTVELQETFDAISSFLTTNSEGSVMGDDQVAAISLQSELLGKYNNGTLPDVFKAPKLC